MSAEQMQAMMSHFNSIPGISMTTTTISGGGAHGDPSDPSNILRHCAAMEERMNTPGTPEHAHIAEQAEAYRLSQKEPVPTAEESTSGFWKHLAEQANQVAPDQAIELDPEEALAAWIQIAEADGQIVVLPQVGATVRLTGLVGKASLNGRTGTLQRAVTGSDGSQRWCVGIQDVHTEEIKTTEAVETDHPPHQPQPAAPPPIQAVAATAAGKQIAVRPANLIVLKGGRVETPAGTLDVTTTAGATVLGQLCHVKDHDPVDSLRKALSYGCNPNTPCLFTGTSDNSWFVNSDVTPGDVCCEIIGHPLTVAVSNGHYDSCELLLKANASPANKDANRLSALHHACKMPQNMHVDFESTTRILKLLLGHGADPSDDDDGNVENVLRFAAKHNHVDAIKVLLASGMHVDDVTEQTGSHRSKWWRTPLMEAVQCGSTDAALALIAAGASLTELDSHGRTAFHIAAARGNKSVVAACLKTDSFDIDLYTAVENKGTRQEFAPNKSKTALQIAVVADNVEMVAQLLEAGASNDLETQSTKEGYDKMTAFELAVGGQTFASQAESVHESLAIGVEVLAINRRKRDFAVQYALSQVGGNNSAIIMLLLEHGASFAAERAIRIAATAGNVFALKVLLGLENEETSRVLDVASPDSNGMSALDLAASHGTLFAGKAAKYDSATNGNNAASKFADTVAFLLDGDPSYGASLAQEDMQAWKEKALWNAAHFGHIDTARVLVEQDDTLNIDTFAGCTTTLLMESSKEGHYAMVLFLLNHGADPSIVDQNGLNARVFARNDAAVLMAMHTWGCELPVKMGIDSMQLMAAQSNLPNIAYYEAKTPTLACIAKVYLLNTNRAPIDGLGPRRRRAVKLLYTQATVQQTVLTAKTKSKTHSNLQNMFPGINVADLMENLPAPAQSGVLSGNLDLTSRSFATALDVLRSKPWSVQNHWLHANTTKEQVHTILLLSNRFSSEADRNAAREDKLEVELAAPFRSLWLPTELWICKILPFVDWTPSLPATAPPTDEAGSAAGAPQPTLSFTVHMGDIAAGENVELQPDGMAQQAGECTVM